jgi:nitrite reductase/ring-hydroxylating ferredoxin subunit
VAAREFVAIAHVEDVAPGTVRVVGAGERELALAHVDGSFYATQNDCRHLKGPLGDGSLAGTVITCPWFGRQYDVRTGENEFDRAITLETFEVAVAAGEVRVAV